MHHEDTEVVVLGLSTGAASRSRGWTVLMVKMRVMVGYEVQGGDFELKPRSPSHYETGEQKVGSKKLKKKAPTIEVSRVQL